MKIIDEERTTVNQWIIYELIHSNHVNYGKFNTDFPYDDGKTDKISILPSILLTQQLSQLAAT